MYADERTAMGRGDYEPATNVLVAAYKKSATLSAEAKGLEEELLERVRADWRELYLSGATVADNRQGGKGRETADFLRSYLTGLFGSSRRQTGTAVGFTDMEVEGLVARLTGDVRRALAGGRKLSAAKLHKAQLDSQRLALAELIATRALEDTEDRSARVFFRAKDLPLLQEVYAGRLGRRRPLLAALEPADWEEVLRLWVRGWRPASEAVRIRVAARVDGAPRGGALDLITTY